ncbi:MAG: suhB 2 [Marmoricola sp.]|nr:suhB 2 [Marmoricola sp.]
MRVGLMEGDLDELLALACSVGREAGDLVRAKRAAGVMIAQTKSSATDIVTEADQASEVLIRERILAARPDDGMLGEEGSDDAGTSGVRWIVDPIDGTVNYAHNLPNYAVSIGVEVDGEIVVGYVLNVAQEREFTAVLGRGATCNGVPVSVAQAVPMDRALIGTGFSYEPELRISQARSFTALIGRIADMRRFGSCALDLCAVADGSLDGYVEEGIGGAWDHAGGGLVVREAGGRTEVLTGAHGRILVIASPAATFEEFRKLVVECGFASPEA